MKRVLAVMLMTFAVGCSSKSGGQQAATDASTDTSSASFASSACGQCVATTCASAISACGGAPDCAAYLTCLDACPLGADGNVLATCASSCPQATSSAGQQAQSQLEACQASAACAACGGTPDAGSDASILHETCQPDLDASNDCSKCIHEQCCDVRSACLNDPDCLTLLNCEADCLSGDPDDAGPAGEPPDGGGYSCDEWCSAKSNPSLDKWAQYMACFILACQGPSQCNGNDACTSCIDQYCASQVLAVMGTPDGYLYGECFGQCATTDTTCQTNCQNAYPSVAQQIAAEESCEQQHCQICAQ